MRTILYVPRLPNGKPAPLNSVVKLYRWGNLICWPLEDGAPYWAQIVERVLALLTFVVFFVHNDAKRRYLVKHSNDLDEMLAGLPTYLVLMEVHLRASHLYWRKTKFKNILKKFFAEIYIEEATDRTVFRKIKQQFCLLLFSSGLYILTLNLYFLKAVYILAVNKREFIFKMIPFVDFQSNIYMFLAMQMSNIWGALIVVSMVSGEENCVALLVYHLNGRYLMMRKALNSKVDTLLQSQFSSRVVEKYERILIETLQENQRLNKFAQEIQAQFSFCLFTIFAFSSVTLCVLGFKAYTNPITSFMYVLWAVAKVQDMIALGQIGTSLSSTTDQLSSMYYESKWEAVIERSSCPQKNVRVMKLVSLCILINKRAFYITGLNFFKVSLTYVTNIFKAAGSYFTFLISMR